MIFLQNEACETQITVDNIFGCREWGWAKEASHGGTNYNARSFSSSFSSTQIL